jgi:tetratricopeptide (TPR) repeat protein
MNRTQVRFDIFILSFFIILVFSLCSAAQTSNVRRKVDKSEILSQLQSHTFKSLNQKLEEYQNAFDEDYQAEDQVFDAFEAFRKADPAYDLIFADWLKVFPGTFAPYAARAEYYCACAVQARGTKRRVEKDQEEYKEMQRYYSLALLDIAEALKLNVQLDVCYAMQTEIGMALETEEGATNALMEASKYHPFGYRVKLKYVQTLTPRKGGSYEKMDGCIRSFEKMADNNPKMKELSAALPAEKGNTFFYLGKYNQAVAMYTEALKHSKYHSYYADRGDAYIRMQEYKLGFADYDRALELSPHNPDYLQRKAQAVAFQTRSAEAQRSQVNNGPSDEYDDWPPKKSDNSQASEHLKKGGDLFRLGQFAEAITEYTEALRFLPNDNVLYYNRGFCYLQTNNEDAALQDFNKSIGLKRDYIPAYFKITTIYANRGMYDEAINSMNSALNIKPDDAELLYCRGKVYEKRGMNVEALQDIRRSCEMGYQRACREYKINK